MVAEAAGLGNLPTVGGRFVEALERQDWETLESCFEASVRFRALTPPGLREAVDSAAATGYLRTWFGDATALVLLGSDITSIQDRLSISYRFRVHEDQWYVVEQRAYCEVAEGRIARLDLLCSGFHAEGAA